MSGSIAANSHGGFRMDGYDVQTWEISKDKAEEVGLLLEIKGDAIFLIREKGHKHYGGFKTVKEVAAFLDRYDWARSEYSVD